MNPGPKGDDGDNGLNAYVHYAYATSADGSQGFSLTYTGVESYIGWYSDFEVDDSELPSAYKWSKFLGPQGPQGLTGAAGAAGADGINARAVDLIASQLAIEYDPEGDLVTESILITAYAKNVALTPYYWFYVNGEAQGY